MSKPKHPEIKVKLVGRDGNALSILGQCTQAMRQAGLSQEQQKTFMTEATSGSYDNLLATVMKWFEVN